MRVERKSKRTKRGVKEGCGREYDRTERAITCDISERAITYDVSERGKRGL